MREMPREQHQQQQVQKQPEARPNPNNSQRREENAHHGQLQQHREYNRRDFTNHQNREYISPPNRDGYLSSREGYSPPGRRDGAHHSPPGRRDGNYQSPPGRREGYSSAREEYGGRREYHEHQQSFNRFNGGRGGGRNNNNFRNNTNYSNRVDKQVSTHNYQPQQTFHNNKRGGHFASTSFHMPQQIPPFAGNRNNHNNNGQFRKQNKQTTARPSTSIPPPQPTIQEEEIECISDQMTDTHEKTNAIDEPQQCEQIEQSEGSIAESTCSSKSEDKTIIEVIAETNVVVEEEKEKVVEETIEIVTEEEEIVAIKFHRYSISKLHEIKEGNPLVVATAADLQHPLVSEKLRGEIRRILFDKDLVVNEKNEYMTRKQNSSFGKSGQLSKRNSGELRRNESFNNGNRNNTSRKGHSPNTSSTNVDDTQMIRINLNENVKLNEAKNAWKPTHLKARENVPDTDRDVIALRKTFRSLLNKMTLENFDHLLPEIHKLKIDTMEKLEMIVSILFEKSISEPGFANMSTLR